jgi:hypothetical protein
MKVYDTLVEALNDLKQRGFTHDFNLDNDCVVCTEINLSLSPEEFDIVETHRFEGETNPSDQSVLYAIESKKGTKGVLVNAFGIYADPISDAMVKKLQ